MTRTSERRDLWSALTYASGFPQLQNTVPKRVEGVEVKVWRPVLSSCNLVRAGPTQFHASTGTDPEPSLTNLVRSNLTMPRKWL